MDEAKIEYDNLLKYLAVEKDVATIHEVQGKLAVLNKMINLKELTESSYEAMLEEEKLEAENDHADV